VLIPCRDEEKTNGTVVAAFTEVLPEATIYFDNASKDARAERAAAAGATIERVPRPCKGNVVSCMFSDIDADYYILVDGDDTYDPSIAVEILARLSDGYDLVNAARVPVGRDSFRLCGLLARYRARPAGSDSRLDKWQGGRKILGAVFGLMRHGRPRAFFSAAGRCSALPRSRSGCPSFLNAGALGASRASPRPFSRQGS